MLLLLVPITKKILSITLTLPSLHSRGTAVKFSTLLKDQRFYILSQSGLWRTLLKSNPNYCTSAIKVL